MAILENLRSMAIWDYNYYHLFLSIDEKKEIHTDSLVSLLWARNKIIVVPKIAGNSDLEHFELQKDSKLLKNKWGIPEPVGGTMVKEELIDLVFIPLLAFDKQGHRVGYGKGYYDKFLESCRTDVIKVGLSLFEATESISDISETDIALDYCVTPLKIYSF